MAILCRRNVNNLLIVFTLYLLKIQPSQVILHSTYTNFFCELYQTHFDIQSNFFTSRKWTAQNALYLCSNLYWQVLNCNNALLRISISLEIRDILYILSTEQKHVTLKHTAVNNKQLDGNPSKLKTITSTRSEWGCNFRDFFLQYNWKRNRFDPYHIKSYPYYFTWNYKVLLRSKNTFHSFTIAANLFCVFRTRGVR